MTCTLKPNKEMKTEKMMRNKFANIQIVILDGAFFLFSFFYVSIVCLLPLFGGRAEWQFQNNRNLQFLPKGIVQVGICWQRRNVSRRQQVLGLLSNASLLLPVEGLRRASHILGVDSRASGPSYTQLQFLTLQSRRPHMDSTL